MDSRYYTIICSSCADLYTVYITKLICVKCGTYCRKCFFGNPLENLSYDNKLYSKEEADIRLD